MDYTDDDIDTLLDKWYNIKQEIALLEKKCDKFKKYAERIMNDKDVNLLSNSVYSLTKREMNRSVLLKEDIPRDIWNKYSKSISYPMYVIKKKKEK
jgi:hypothetical protein